ncbi:tape measure protein [Synechococcus virus S-ESS1]|uniref:Tape measure protein n=1 Tax=Synechococcus virus S-ESS1 TaxID=1964565 RepID=A0A1V0DX08_9CAUD|nr:tail length tape measure protein [Synechococcus virus S-ESS1]ARB05695.1 tape measure protein [Synechococcus virus S-ESS1]
MTIFQAQAQAAATSLNRQDTALRKIKDNIKGLDAAVKGATGEQSRLSTQITRTKSSLDQQEQSVARAEAAYVELALSARQADAQLAELSQRSLGRLDEQLVEQGIAASRAKAEFNELDAEARKLRSAIGAVGVPTREMAAALAFAAQKADEAQFAFLLQQETLERMGRAYRDVQGDLQSTAAVSARFEQEQRELSTAMRKVADDGLRQRNVLRGLNDTYTQAASVSNRLEQTTRGVAAANERGASATSRMAAAYREFYGDSRRSLSLLQRIRGEVLSLVAAYGGLYGAIEVLRGTVEAYQTLEAAQARLSVAVGGDQDLAAQELDFVRRTADRLGISFGVLSQEYSKFAIATKETRLEGEATRKIFLAVAEAARVNRSSTSEMAGVLTALTQIVSKGAVQMEELRQQLGDRLPGAIRIMADGLGVTTERLIEMMEAGEVTSDALLPFADELTKRFGPGLADALKSTSTAIGRLGNEAFEALLRFGQAGFLEAFTDLALTITDTLKSADFQAFSDNASAAMAKLVNFIGFAIENFRVLAAVITAFIGLRLTPIVLAVAATFRDFAREVKVAGVALATTGAQAQGATGRLAAMTGAVGRLRIALTGLLSTTGIGLLVAAIGAGIALWATEADNATEALVEHEAIVDQVKNT